MIGDKTAILGSKLEVDSWQVSFEIMERFKASIKNSDGEDVNFNFFAHRENETTQFARGDLGLIKECFPDFKIIDKRSTKPIQIPLEFTGQLRPHQQSVADKIVNGQGNGTISAPPRFGKTVVMCYIACKLKLKALFLSHQIDLSKQALKTFYDFTNVMDLEYEAGKQLIGIVNDWEDLNKYDICFMPYQKFVMGKNADEMLEKYRDEFGLVFVDEAHRSNATRYSQVVSSFNPKYRHGVSATIEIKSQRHVINNFVLGPIVAEGVTDQVHCQARVVETGVWLPLHSSGDKYFFGKMLNFLASHQQRNDFLVSYIESYAVAGHFCIAVADRVNMLNYVTEKLKNKGIAAQAFHRKAVPKKQLREQVLTKCRNGEITVLVALRSMVLGLDIPRLTAFFNLTPTANQPNYYQELSRVRTPYEGKYMAYIVDFLDAHPIAAACLKTREKVYQKERFEIIRI